jgi:hypothetical protein
MLAPLRISSYMFLALPYIRINVSVRMYSLSSLLGTREHEVVPVNAENPNVGTEVQLHTFLTSIFIEGQWSFLCTEGFSP